MILNNKEQNSSNVLHIFCDGSVNPKSKVGTGSYLVLKDLNLDLNDIKDLIISNKFTNTSSSKLELENIIFALKNIEATSEKIYLYTDSSTVEGLKNRRERLELNKFKSRATNKDLNNKDLYIEYYKLSDLINLEVIKVKGHKKSSLKNTIDKIFSLVDKNSREELRKLLS